MKKQNKIKEFIAEHKPEAIATVATVTAAVAGIAYYAHYVSSFNREVTEEDLNDALVDVNDAIDDYNDLLDKYSQSKK